MEKRFDDKKIKSGNGSFLQRKNGRKVFLNLHIMPQDRESKDTKVFSWLTAGLLILISLIIFLMIYV